MAQFSILPPLTKVAAFFKEVTGQPCEVDTTWSIWITDSDLSHYFDEFRFWYRPCHLKILNDTVAALHVNPAPLLRQLLRPHGLGIQYRKNMWKLVKEKAVKIVEEPITVDWI